MHEFLSILNTMEQLGQIGKGEAQKLRNRIDDRDYAHAAMYVGHLACTNRIPEYEGWRLVYAIADNTPRPFLVG